MVVTLSVPVKANSGVRARFPAAGKVLEGDDKPTLLREDQHYLHYITICEGVYSLQFSNGSTLSKAGFKCYCLVLSDGSLVKLGIF